ncbi:hypothetical protein FOCC_FOCC004207 [Frankliniella occidentalis]|nr:hypothetical protein FOCC_FOCC004207 [Frankliniella occidentalis]
MHAAIAVPVWPGLGSAAAPPARAPAPPAAAARDGMAPRCLLLRCCCGGQVHDADTAAAPPPPSKSTTKSAAASSAKSRKCTASCLQPDNLPSYVSEPPPSCRKLLRKRDGPSKVVLFPDEAWARNATSSYWTLTPVWWSRSRCVVVEVSGTRRFIG